MRRGEYLFSFSIFFSFIVYVNFVSFFNDMKINCVV